MSGDPMDELWMLFGAELDEYLSAGENILGESGGVGSRVDELFRAFHSIKGGSAALGLRCLETVAHAAEDVLHQVRNGSLAMTPAIEAGLLAAVDELRRLQETAFASRSDQPPNRALVDRLHTLLPGAAAAHKPAAGTGPASPAPAPAAAAGGDSGRSTESGGGLPALSPAGMAEPIVDAALLQDAILSLAGALETDPGEAAAYLSYLAGDQGQYGLGDAASRLTDGYDPDSAADRWRLLDLIERLRALERGAGMTLGAAALGGAAEPQIAAMLLDISAELKDQVGDSFLWRRVCRLAAALDLNELVALADLAANRLDAGETGDPLDEIADLIALTGICLESGAGAPADEIEALRISWFRACGLAIDTDAEEDGDSDAPNPYPAWLSPEGQAALAGAMVSGRALLLILLDLEADPALAERVLEPLQDEVTISNRSRLDVGTGYFEFFVGVAEEPAEFVHRLAGLDQRRRCLRSVRRSDISGTSGAEMLPPASGPRTGAVAEPAVAAAGLQAAKPAAPPAQPAGTNAPGRVVESMVRVPSSAIDGIMDRLGDLRLGLTALGMALDRFSGSGFQQRLNQVIETESGRNRTELMSIAREFGDLRQNLQDGFTRLDSGIRQLYGATTALRVVAISTLFQRLLRPVRETMVAVGKDVTMSTTGDEVQIDKSMIELLVDPLTHIVRNAVDHGIEMPDVREASGKSRNGNLLVRASQGTGMASIEVIDDGAGIDLDRVRSKAVEKGLISAAAVAVLNERESLELILLPGFSTRDTVSATSGRGVGMDIVATAIRKLGGTLQIESRRGEGTRLLLEFPISAAIQRVVTAEVGGQLVAILERSVSEIIQVEATEYHAVAGGRGLFLRGRFLPVVDLGVLVGWRDRAPAAERSQIIIINDNRRQIGLSVDWLIGRQEVFFKRLHPLLESNRLLAGVAVIGAGSLVFALDAAPLIDAAQRLREPSLAAVPPHTSPPHGLPSHGG
jgi:two-component system, chemotaxis family, sensor kinase CheA